MIMTMMAMMTMMKMIKISNGDKYVLTLKQLRGKYPEDEDYGDDDNDDNDGDGDVYSSALEVDPKHLHDEESLHR